MPSGIRDGIRTNFCSRPRIRHSWPSLQLTPGRHCLVGVLHQVLNDLAELPISCHRPKVLSEVEIALGHRAVKGKTGRVPEQGAHLDDFLDGLAAPGKGQELHGQCFGLKSGMLSILEAKGRFSRILT